MAFDYSKLLGKITEKYGTQARFAKDMELSERSMSLKLNGKRQWTQREIVRACEKLGLDVSEMTAYFFTLQVQS